MVTCRKIKLTNYDWIRLYYHTKSFANKSSFDTVFPYNVKLRLFRNKPMIILYGANKQYAAYDEIFG